MFVLQLPKPTPPFASRVQQHVVLPLMHVSPPHEMLPAVGDGDGEGAVGPASTAASEPASDLPGGVPASFADGPDGFSSALSAEGSDGDALLVGVDGSPAETSVVDEQASAKSTAKEIEAAAFTPRAEQRAYRPICAATR